MIRKILLAITLLYGTTPFASQAITDNTAKTCVVGAGVLGCWLR